MQDYRKLKVWEAAHALTLAVYRASAGFPSGERYGLTSQWRRACASVGANIAEGCGRGSNPDMARCLRIALGSAFEAEYHLLLARDLGLLTAAAYAALQQQTLGIKRMLAGLIQSLRPVG